MTEFFFIRPYWLFGAVICCLISYLLLRANQAKSQWWELMDNHIAHSLIEAKGGNKWFSPINLLLILIAAVCIALAGPSFSKQLPDELKGKASVIVLLSNSDSMYAGDITPNRNRVAKQKIKNLRKLMPESQFGLIAYANSAHQVSPLTSDPKFMDFYLTPLEPKLMPDRELLSSGLKDGLQQVEEMSKQAHYPVSLVIMADQLTQEDRDEIIDIQRRSKLGIQVLAIGTAEGGTFRFVESKDVQESADTRMDLSQFEALKNQDITVVGVTQNSEDIRWISEKVKQSVAAIHDTNSNFSPKDSGYWLALIFIPACLALFRKRTWVMSFAPLLLVCSMGITPSAEAGTWEELWWSPDQLGQKALSQNDFQTAANQFENPYLKGWALYQLGEYQAAESQFRKVESAESFFYLANTLTMQEKYKEALEYYGKAVALRSDFMEAKKNIAVTKAALATANKISGNEREVEDDGQVMLQVGVQGAAEKKASPYIDPLVYSEEELNVWLEKVKSSPEKLLKTKFELQSQNRMIDEL